MTSRSTRLWITLLLCAFAASCSRPPQPPEGLEEPGGGGEQQTSRLADEVSLLDETAEEYMERRGDRELEPGEAAPEAVGAIVQCAVCHGSQGGGNEALDTPLIGGLAEWYLARQLKYFKAGVRAPSDADAHGMQMRAIVLPLPDSALEDLAAHVSRMDPPPAPALDEGDPERGEQLYPVCAACHGPDAEGNMALNTPSLAKQSGQYLVRQLEHFRSGLRGGHPKDVFGQQMLPIVESTLNSRQDAVDVVAYIGSLRDAPADPAEGTAAEPE